MAKRLSDLYELHVHGNTYHSENYITTSYVDGKLKSYTWQNKVISFYDPSSGLPSSPSLGDRYIASSTANGWTKNYIYEWDNESWVQTIPLEGFELFVENETRNYVYSGSSWSILETIVSHNDLALSGSDEGYHLQQTAYDNLKNQDQEVYTTSIPTFDDLEITTPSTIYTSLNHDDFNDYVTEEHRQWENSITQDVHEDNITSLSITQHENDITHNNLGSVFGDSEGYHLQQSAYSNLKNQDQEVYSTSTPSFPNVYSTNSPTEFNHLTRKDYVDGIFLEGSMFWRPPVIDFYDPNTGLPSGSDGDRYISNGTANGWTDNHIFEYEGSTDSWVEYTPSGGWTLLVEVEDRIYTYREDDINDWVKMASFLYHNNMNGLQGGTSDQYYHLTSSQQSNLTATTPSFNDLEITSPSTIYTSLNHDDFNDYVADEHIDWTVTGSTTIHDDRIASSSITQHETFIDHDVLTNFVSNEHIDWTSDQGTTNINDANIQKTAITQNSYTYSDLSLNIDDTPVNGVTSEPISSNWAYDHSNNSSAHHTKYALTDDLTSGEITQIQNINSVTISNSQWGWIGGLGSTPLESGNNLSGLTSTSSARNNLGLGTAATKAADQNLQTTDNVTHNDFNATNILSEQGSRVGPIESYLLDLDSDFSGEQLKLSRIGNTVFATLVGNVSMSTSRSLHLTTGGPVPSYLRPISDLHAVTSVGASAVQEVVIASDGDLKVFFSDWSGSGVSDDWITFFSVSWQINL